MMLALAAGGTEPDDAADASVVIVKDCLPSLPEILHVSEAGSNPSDAACHCRLGIWCHDVMSLFLPINI